MKKIFPIVIAVIVLLIIASFAVFLSVLHGDFNNQSATQSTEVIATEPEPPTPEPTINEPEQGLSRYVVVKDIGDGYTAGVDILTSDGRLVVTAKYEYVVDRKTKQIFIFDEYANGATPSKEAFNLIPLLENNEIVYYEGELPQ